MVGGMSDADTIAFDPGRIKAVAFDYGNTLIEFGPSQARACDDALADALDALYGPTDRDALRRERHADRLAPYSGDPPAWRENDLPAITARVVRALHGRVPTAAELKRLLRVRFEAFVAAVTAPDYLPGLLARLADGRRLAILSNYPDGDAIRASLRATGLDRWFEVVVVSGDLGFVKPHPLPFTRLLDGLAQPAEEVLYVGDNWLADVQGARRAGCPVVWTRQWTPIENLPPRADDRPPQATIGHLNELAGLLGV